MKTREQGIDEMRQTLKAALQKKGDGFAQRTILNRLAVASYINQEPILEFLEREILAIHSTGQAAITVPVQEDEKIQCPGCGKDFASMVSLNGHGPARCLKKSKG